MLDCIETNTAPSPQGLENCSITDIFCYHIMSSEDGGHESAFPELHAGARESCCAKSSCCISTSIRFNGWHPRMMILLLSVLHLHSDLANLRQRILIAWLQEEACPSGDSRWHTFEHLRTNTKQLPQSKQCLSVWQGTMVYTSSLRASSMLFKASSGCKRWATSWLSGQYCLQTNSVHEPPLVTDSTTWHLIFHPVQSCCNPLEPAY